MTPFGSELHARIQSMFAPKEQLKAASYGVAPGEAGEERVIQSEAPVTPDVPAATPAPVYSGGGGDPSPIVNAVQDAFTPTAGKAPGATSVNYGGPNPEDPYGGMGPPASPGAPLAGGDVISSQDPHAPLAGGDVIYAPTPAPPAPQVQATPEVAYSQMYQDQQARAAALQAFLARGDWRNFQ